MYQTKPKGKSAQNAKRRVASNPYRSKSYKGKSENSQTQSNSNRDGSKKPYFKSARPTGPRGPQQNRTRNRFRGAYINPQMFINKAIVPVEPEEKVHVAKALFTSLDLNKQLQEAVAKRGYTHPTDIQVKTIPHILKGKDVIGLANTGTGKTGAFLLPMINKIMADPRQKLLVMVPTRELAIQIQEEFVALTQELRLKSVVVVGGANIRPQIEKLRSAHNIVIGTPGRIKDLISRKNLRLEHFNNVVLDEADRMLDMGFINDMKTILSLLAKPRQTLLFSATLSKEIESLVQQFQKDPITVSIKTKEVSSQIDQDVVKIGRDDDKIEILKKLLAQTAFQKILIFTRTKRGAEKLSKALFKMGFRSESIHGDKSHGQRQKALQLFKNDHIEILVATDVAARGLDIPNVSHVINFDVPASYEDYIHRIGRTGRAGKTGVALTFIE
ncbi:MAG: DEAD/DEAH box helicase domain protein [Candidatus Moranbacteria bacterium GW2011_GWF2_34_56]|nr:MAG: DEAD/DEAH box helicase domain protein [Candidatus Moranbacteria bacterium GW2011_GWF1_34_10]KKP65202.1 MAG: DEAD/DEAH box helicase domain protein [Candidatus Moranbacteria bacterium GW2011_GWF2_34_56]HBI17654.1 ATP-dependent helicase [Candidatus Moranbacteria bacterium]